jgi:hypothetical protein
MNRRVLRLWLFSTFAPFAVFTGYLLLSRGTMWRSTAMRLDTPALVMSVLIGLGFIAALPVPRRMRLLVGMVYVPIMGLGLLFYAFFFVCEVFGDCL